MKIEFTYTLLDHGWAVAELSARKFSKKFPASHILDSLKYIVQAAIGLSNTWTRAFIPFFSEPGEHQMVIEKIDHLRIKIELRWYETCVSINETNSEDYVLSFCGETTLKSFLKGSFHSAKNILEENGMDGYRAKWRKDFPMDDFRKLEKLMSAPES